MPFQRNSWMKITRWVMISKHKRRLGDFNPDKTEIILFHPDWMKSQVIIGGTMIGGECIRFSKLVKNVGVWLDCNMNLNMHVNKIVAQCYRLLRNLGRDRNLISVKDTETLVHAVISSRLDHCNSILINISKSNLFKLQKFRTRQQD